ncbi:MAG: hypothetical protein LQ351_004166 [Letrouitia transgressa]|nr:MAG: hypothetical protein LQ351_004166 [Letrouitia transgressa]
MDHTFSPLSFQPDDYYPPRETISLSETTLMDPSTPESVCEPKDDAEEKKPAKKRKSWGQELPTPKTNLPPRKRAKTEDEKEQRRIERVLRNRQAAQSSRERKRQEVEKLEGEKQTIEEHNKLLKERLMAAEHEKFKLQTQVARMAAELSALRSGSSSSRSSVDHSHDLGADLLNQQQIKQEVEQQYPYQLHSPPDSIGQCPSSSFSPTPSFSSFSRSPSPSQLGLGFHALNTSPDMTQHPAVIVHDPRRNSTPINPISTKPQYPQHPTILSDPMYNHLFAARSSPPPDLSFFEDGLASIEQPDDATNVFSFDSMVDLDACGSHGLDHGINGNNVDINSNQGLFQDSDTLSTNFPHQTAATPPALQPCLGAPSSGRDGSGNAS